MESLGPIFSTLIYAVIFSAAVLFIGVNAYYLYIHRKYAHLPTPKGAKFYSGHIPMLAENLKKGRYKMDFFKSWADECGPVFVFWIYMRPAVMVAHPEIMKELGTIKHPKAHLGPLIYLWNRQRLVGKSLFSIQYHEEWKDRRRMYDPSFTRHSLDNLVPQFNNVVKKYLVDYLETFADGKTKVDMKGVFSRITLEVISWVAFGMDFFEDEYITQVLCGSRNLLKFLEITLEGVTLHLSNPLLPYVKPFGGYEYFDAAAKLRKIGHYCIEKRIESMKHGEQCPQDILTQIIALSQKESDSLRLEDLVDDFITFYVAGQETTSNTLSFLLVELLQTPDILQRLQTEINEVVGDCKVIDKAHLSKLEYTQAVIEETLRLHPTAAVFGKIAAEDIVTADYMIPKNTKVLCSPYISHRDPEHFDDPLKFDPSHFEAGQKRPSPYVYMPFGIGHRSCIGRVFAMMEMKVILAYLLKNFEFTLQEGYKLNKVHTITSKPADEIPCFIVMKQ